MVLAQSIKSVLRTPLKTILFIILIAAVTVFACLGIGMLSSGNRLLSAADNAYTTKAIIEYVDDGYPDASRYSDVMMRELSGYDYSRLSDNANVLNFERQYELGGYIEGYSSKSRNNPFGKQAVLVFRYREETEYGSACVILEALYKGDSRLKVDSIFYLAFDKESYKGKAAFVLKEGSVYIAAGTFEKGYMNTDTLIITPYVNSNAPEKELFSMPVWDITDRYESEEYKEAEEYELFTNIVTAYNAMNNYVCVLPTNDVKSASVFIMQQTSLKEDDVSRFFTDAEYAEGADVIIISDYVAKRMGIGVGDSIRLNLYTGGRDGTFAKDSFWPDGKYLTSGDYTVVGVFKENKSINNIAFIPYPKGSENWLPQDSVCYTVASVKLKNGTAEDYTKAIEPYLLSPMRVSVFDQGYSETIAPILAMRQTAVLLSIIGAVCCMVVLILFAYLNYAKQKDTAKTMISLGSGKLRAVAYILICVFIVAAAASAIGAVLGYRLSEKVTEKAYEKAELTTTVDNRFSDIYMNDTDVDFNLGFAPDVKPIAAVAAAITFASVLITLIIAVISHEADRRSKAPAKAKAIRVRVREEQRTESKKVYAPLKKSMFARASLCAELAVNAIKRGGGRNLIVPAAVFIMIVFIGIFARQIATSEDRINEVYNSSNVYAYYTTSVGKRADSLSMIEDDFAEAAADEHVEDVYLTATRYMQLCGYKKAGSDEWIDKFEPEIPGGGFALDTDTSWGAGQGDQNGMVENFALITMLNDLINYDRVVFTASIKNSPEFLFENELHIKYLEGYDESSFRGDECICAMPKTYMEQLGYELGDTVNICVFTSDDEYIDTLMREALIAASFEKADSKNNIYMPLSFNEYYYYMLYKISEDTTGEKKSIKTPVEDMEKYALFGGHYEVVAEPFPYSSVAFKLTELRTLNEFKDKLIDMGYSPVGSFGKARMWLVVKDNFLNESIVNINRHISYMTLLFIVVYILAVAIGFVLSYLLTKSRRSELAMMRSMGTGRLRTFGVLLLEQLLLSIIGGALGIGAVWLIFKEILKLQWLGFAGYFICYWIGVFISAAVMNRVDVIKILGEKD